MSSEQAAMQGAGTGAAAGSVGGPWGAVIGAGVGGLMGYLGAEEQERKAKKAHKKNEAIKRQQNRYAPFFGKQPRLEEVRTSGSSAGPAMGGAILGAEQGGKIANMYARSQGQSQPQPQIEQAQMPISSYVRRPNPNEVDPRTISPAIRRPPEYEPLQNPYAYDPAYQGRY